MEAKIFFESWCVGFGQITISKLQTSKIPRDKLNMKYAWPMKKVIKWAEEHKRWQKNERHLLLAGNTQ